MGGLGPRLPFGRPGTATYAGRVRTPHHQRSTFHVNDQPRRRPAKPHRRPQKDPVRFLAFEALRAVDERDAYANLVLPRC